MYCYQHESWCRKHSDRSSILHLLVNSTTRDSVSRTKTRSSRANKHNRHPRSSILYSCRSILLFVVVVLPRRSRSGITRHHPQSSIHLVVVLPRRGRGATNTTQRHPHPRRRVTKKKSWEKSTQRHPYCRIHFLPVVMPSSSVYYEEVWGKKTQSHPRRSGRSTREFLSMRRTDVVIPFPSSCNCGMHGRPHRCRGAGTTTTVVFSSPWKS